MPAKTQSEPHWATDQVLVLLRRAGPDGVEKDELVEDSGLDASDLRPAIEELIKRGDVEETEDGFALRVTDGEAPTAEVLRDEGEVQSVAAPEQSDAAPTRADASYRARLTVEVSYAATRSKDPDATARSTAESLQERITLLLREELPGVEVRIEQLQAYDRPRLVELKAEEEERNVAPAPGGAEEGE